MRSALVACPKTAKLSQTNLSEANIPMNRITTREAISNLLFMEDPVQSVDLVLVLGNTWLPSMDPAIEMLTHGHARHVLIVGGVYGGEEGRPESEALMAYALERGVSQDKMILETKSTNTLENFVLSRDIVEGSIGWSNVRKVAVVCKAFHTRRVLMTAKKNWPAHVEYIFRPVEDEREIRREGWWEDSVARERVLAEVRRIAEYAIKGDLGDV